MNESLLERKGKMRLDATAFTRRHIGAARTRDTSPAAISNCATFRQTLRAMSWMIGSMGMNLFSPIGLACKGLIWQSNLFKGLSYTV